MLRLSSECRRCVAAWLAVQSEKGSLSAVEKKGHFSVKTVENRTFAEKEENKWGTEEMFCHAPSPGAAIEAWGEQGAGFPCAP